MTTKQAVAAAATLNLGLATTELTPAINALVKNDEKAFDMVLNAYRQRDGIDELTGPVADVKVAKRVKTIAKDVTAKLKAEKKASKQVKKPAAKKAVAKVTPKPAEKAPKGPSRVQRMFEHVLAGLSNAAAVDAIRDEFGKDVPTNTSSIGWCRSQLRAKTNYAKKYNPRGKAVPTDREAQEKAAKA